MRALFPSHCIYPPTPGAHLKGASGAHLRGMKCAPHPLKVDTSTPKPHRNRRKESFSALATDRENPFLTNSTKSANKAYYPSLSLFLSFIDFNQIAPPETPQRKDLVFQVQSLSLRGAFSLFSGSVFFIFEVQSLSLLTEQSKLPFTGERKCAVFGALQVQIRSPAFEIGTPDFVFTSHGLLRCKPYAPTAIPFRQ